MINMQDLTAFGKNDIRGIYGQNVTEELFYYVGKGFIRYIKEKTGMNASDVWVSVAKDARLHSESLLKVLIKGIVHTGANVVNLDLIPTPLGYYSEFATYPQSISENVRVSGALIVTASHNPPEYNGLKMTFDKMSLNETEIQLVKKYTQEEMSSDISVVKHGESRLYNIIPQYVDSVASKFPMVGKSIKVVTDCANGTAGVVAPKLYKEIGCEVIELYSEPDGKFPNHHPNPSDFSTLETLRKKVLETKADLGIAFDGDSDRLGVITSDGEILTGDKLLYIYAQDVIKDLTLRGEKPVIVSEVKCSQVLYDEINKQGGVAVMARTGHGYIKAKMRETGAILAGEMSGHMFFKDRYYGFDDAVYAGCRFIEIVAKHKKTNPNFKISEFIDSLPWASASKEVRYKCPNEFKMIILTELSELFEKDKNIFCNPIKDIITIDGLRLVFPDGFALIRASNTEPVFTMRFEAKTEENSKNYKEKMLELVDGMLEKLQVQNVKN